MLRNHGATESQALRERFHVTEVRQRLLTPDALDPLHACLNRDFQLLTYLLEHASGLELSSIEDRLLVLDYKLMRFCYRVTRTLAPQQARQALSEMASVITVLAVKIDECAGVHSQA